MLHAFVIRTLSLVAVCGVSAVMTASAASADLASLIDRAASASQATVLLVPPMTLYRTRIDEGRLENAGCRYATSDPVAIRALVGLFRNADVSVDRVYQTLDLREGVYLTMDDGSLLKFFLQDNMGGNLPVKGVAETSASGSVRSMTITGRRTLAVDLRTWAAKFVAAGNGTCDRVPQRRVHADPVDTGVGVSGPR